MKFSHRYAPRAKGEGEGKERAVNNLLIAWAWSQMKLAVREISPSNVILSVSHPSAALTECDTEAGSRTSA